MNVRHLLAIYGASGAGRGIMPLLREQISGLSEIECIFIDDGEGPPLVNGHRRLSFEQLVREPAEHKAVAIAIASSEIRRRLADKCAQSGINFMSVVARDHVRMDDVVVGEGAIFSPFTTVTSNIRIGRHFHCNINSYVEHDCIIGDFVTFAPGVHCNGNVHIADGAYVGAGATIRQGRPGAPLRIGARATVGMGAVVLTDVAAGVTVVGNPARPLRR